MNTYTARAGDQFVETSTGNLFEVAYAFPAGSAGTKYSDGPHVVMRIVGKDGKAHLGGYTVTVSHGHYHKPDMFELPKTL